MCTQYEVRSLVMYWHDCKTLSSCKTPDNVTLIAVSLRHVQSHSFWNCCKKPQSVYIWPVEFLSCYKHVWMFIFQVPFTTNYEHTFNQTAFNLNRQIIHTLCATFKLHFDLLLTIGVLTTPTKMITNTLEHAFIIDNRSTIININTLSFASFQIMLGIILNCNITVCPSQAKDLSVPLLSPQLPIILHSISTQPGITHPSTRSYRKVLANFVKKILLARKCFLYW